jgi:hypothetical protein
MKYILAVSAALLVAAVLLGPRIMPGQRHVVARLQHVEGEVTVEQEGRPAQAAAASGNVLAGQRLVIPADGSVTVAYPDGTTVAAEGGTHMSFAIDRASAAKEVQVDRGRLSASIARQSIGMRFVTPHALATVLGTELRLQVTDAATQLDVTKGRVQFDHAGSRRSLDVRALDSAIASADSLEAARRKWPNDKSSVAYLLSPFETLDPGQPLMVARNPESGLMRDTALAARGAARLQGESLHFELSGGSLVSDDAGNDLLRTFAAREALTLEVVFAPAAAEQAGTIAAFAAQGVQANFRLEQAHRSLRFSLRDHAEPPPAIEISLEDTSGVVHLAVVCHGGELAAYLEGAEVAREPISHAPFSAWLPGPLMLGSDADGNSAWEGRIEAFVLHDRALAPGEVAASARSYRLLSGRGQ